VNDLAADLYGIVDAQSVHTRIHRCVVLRDWPALSGRIDGLSASSGCWRLVAFNIEH
jgi:hypothetical protein